VYTVNPVNVSEILSKVCVKTLKTIAGTVKKFIKIMQIRLWKSIPNVKFMEVRAGGGGLYSSTTPISLHFHSYKEKFDAPFKNFYYFLENCRSRIM
jgi:hypothetical protein